MRWGCWCCLLAGTTMLVLPEPGQAGVWTRERPDGTVEFTNVPPSGRGWSSDKSDAERARPPSHPAPAVAPAVGSPASRAPAGRGSGAFWYREREDGVVEFTNLHPVGAKWKVLFKTGPGKARALRGTTDRVPARDLSPERFSRFDRHLLDQQAFYGIPLAFLRAVIKTESDYDPKVVSSVGAMGLMQLMPATARSMGVTDPFDPRQNIMGGARYLQILARMFCNTHAPGAAGLVTAHCSQDEHVKVISAYHAGPGAVRKYGGMPPYQTTRAYVSNVLSRFERYQEIERAQAMGTRGETL